MFGDIDKEWHDMGIMFAVVAILCMAFLLAWGVAGWVKNRRASTRSIELRCRYVTLPLLMPGMAASVALSLNSPWWMHVVIGVAWGVSYPFRVTVSNAIIHRKGRFDMLFSSVSWWAATVLVMIHALLWPVSVPACQFLANISGLSAKPLTNDPEE